MIAKIVKYVLWRPRYWFQFINLAFVKPIQIRFKLHTYGMYNKLYYPAEIRNKCKSIKVESYIKPPISWDFFNLQLVSQDTSKFMVNCAGVEVTIGQLPSLWRKSIDENIDPEVLQSSHRFHWLVERVSQEINTDDIDSMFHIINSWINDFQHKRTGVAWHPYTVSERLCNWITFWQISGPQIHAQDISYKWLNSIQEHAIFLANTLEYPASKIINNHILNNARALYISGCFLDNKNITDLGRELFTRHLPDMVSKNGFLLESSFHYQLLLTRSIFEVQKVAKKYQDLKFSKWVCSFSTSMLKACQNTIPTNLHNLNDMPRIGDVSPDIPFTWFSPISYRLNADWNTLWNVTTNNIGNNHSINQDDGWVSFNKDNWSLVAFTHPDKTQYPVGHGHNDFGSFCLYFSGYPIFIDIGRLNYVPLESGGSIGTKAESHNVLLIDSQEALFSGHGVSSIVSAESIKHTNFSIDNNGFSVWELICQNGEKWTRNIKIDSNKCITLSDRIDFCKEVKGFFNLHPGTNVEQINSKHIRLLFDNFQCDICFLNIQNLFIENIDFFPNYGEKIDSKRIVWYSLRNNKHIEHKIQILIEKVTLN